MEKEPRKYTLGDVLPPRTIDDVIDFNDEDEGVAFWEKEIDMLFDRLYTKIGRELTGEEYYGVLEIVEELSPKDNDGKKYLRAVLPLRPRVADLSIQKGK